MKQHQMHATKEMNDRAKALGVDVDIDITVAHDPPSEEVEKIREAIHAGHMAVLESLEKSVFSVVRGVREKAQRKTVVDELSQETIEALAESHIRRFTNLLDVRGPRARDVRRAECERYLAIWTLVREHNRDKVPLEPTGREEILEALVSGDFDSYLSAGELHAVEKWRGE